MWSIAVLLLISTIHVCEEQAPKIIESGSKSATDGNEDKCLDDQELLSTFRTAVGAFTAKLINKVSSIGGHYMAIAPLSVWITLAAIAEGLDTKTQNDLFKFLNLPANICSRQKLYQLAVTRCFSSKYVNVLNKRILIVDNGITVDSYWYDFVKQYSLLQIIPAPIKRNAVATVQVLKYFVMTNHEISFKGNSILLNSMDYDGFWETAFPASVSRFSPFYSQAGRPIGSVDLMTMNRTVRIGYVASIKAKILELPIGINGEYKMIFALVVDRNSSIHTLVENIHEFIMFEIKDSLQDSPIPIVVKIPRFLMKSEIDMRRILEDMGIVSLWRDPKATRLISSPAALPASYIQRNTLTLKNEGIRPAYYPEYIPLRRSHEEGRYWKEFVVDRPFMVALVDSQTYTCLMVALYSQPTYPF